MADVESTCDKVETVTAKATTQDPYTLGVLRSIVEKSDLFPDTTPVVFSVKGTAYQPDLIVIKYQTPIDPEPEPIDPEPVPDF